MGSSIYTRSGDKGETSLADGRRVGKESLRVEAYGDLDEANSWVGAARAFCTDALLERALEFVQHRLYNCTSNLATPADSGFKPVLISEADIAFLERAVDRFELDTGKLKNFVVPGGCRAAGLLHVARTVCRRAERRITALGREEATDPLVLAFVNRCSDFLFAAARYSNRITQSDASCGGDVIWKRDCPIPEL